MLLLGWKCRINCMGVWAKGVWVQHSHNEWRLSRLSCLPRRRDPRRETFSAMPAASAANQRQKWCLMADWLHFEVSVNRAIQLSVSSDDFVSLCNAYTHERDFWVNKSFIRAMKELSVFFLDPDFESLVYGSTCTDPPASRCCKSTSSAPGPWLLLLLISPFRIYDQGSNFTNRCCLIVHLAVQFYLTSPV